MVKSQAVFLVHYHEVGLKGKNRSRFEHILIDNLYYALRDIVTREFGLKISRISGHELVEYPASFDSKKIFAALCAVPGVARVSFAYKCPLDFKVICNVAITAIFEALPATSFKVSAKRSNTLFSMHTMELNKEVGAVLCRAFPNLHVDVHNPDVNIRVLINQDAAYVWTQSQVGSGGLPVGTAAKCVSLFSSGFDSPIATWMMGRRGAPVVPVHFSGRPEVSSESEELCIELVRALGPAGIIGRFYVVPFGTIQKEIALAVPENLRILMYRRLMFKISEYIAHVEGAKALITGESLGQVASQTLENMWATNSVVDSLPILRPLVGSDKQEIIEKARALGTYDISSEVAPDACTLFMPKHPETHANIRRVLSIWNDLPIASYVEQALDNLEYIDFPTCRVYQRPKRWYDFHSELAPIV